MSRFSYRGYRPNSQTAHASGKLRQKIQSLGVKVNRFRRFSWSLKFARMKNH
jgi:hypothetical protein